MHARPPRGSLAASIVGRGASWCVAGEPAAGSSRIRAWSATSAPRQQPQSSTTRRAAFTTRRPRGAARSEPQRSVRERGSGQGTCRRRRLSACVAAGAGPAVHAKRLDEGALRFESWRARARSRVRARELRCRGAANTGDPEASGHNLLCPERAPLKPRPGIKTTAARARSVITGWPSFTARDRSGHPAAGRHEQARVPAGPSAEGPIMPGIIGRRDQSGAARTPRGRRRAGCGSCLLLRAAVMQPA